MSFGSLSALSGLSRDFAQLLRRNGRLVLASSMYAGERIVAAVASLLVFVMLARIYGPHDFGIWSYTLGVMQFAAAALVGAAEPIVVRELVHRPRDAGVVLGSAAATLAGATVLALVLPLAFLFFKHGSDDTVMRIALLSALAYGPAVFFVIEHHFRALQMPLPIAAARFFAMLVGAVAKVSLALAGSGIATLAWVLVAESLVQVAILVLALRNASQGGLRWRVERPVVAQLLSRCLPAMVAAVAVTLFFRVNYLIVEALQGFEQVGYYAFAFNVMQLALVVPGMLMAGLYPRLCELIERDPARFRQVVAWLFFGAAAFGYGAAIFIALFGQALVGLLFGAKYLPAVPVLSWMFVAMAALATATVRAAVINVQQAQSLHLWSALIGLATLVPSSLWLVPMWGARGAAIAVVGSALVSGALTSFVFRKLRPHALDQLQALLLLTPFLALSRLRAPRSAGPTAVETRP